MCHRNGSIYTNRSGGMSSYFYTLIITSVCGAICAMLAWGGFEKYIKYIASLVCICLIIAPFRDIDLSQAKDLITEEVSSVTPELPNGLYPLAAEITEQRAEEYISEIVFTKFGIKTVSADIKIDWESEEAIIESITVTLSKKDMKYSAEASAYLETVLGGEVTIIEG